MITETGSNTVWVKCGGADKERVTVMLLGDSSGITYPLFLVFKAAALSVPSVRAEKAASRHGFGWRLWKEIEYIQEFTNSQICGNQAAWWNASITIAFLKHHFGERCATDVPVFLLLDDFSAHWTAEVRACAESVGVIPEKIPPRMTWRCQPANTTWNKPLKDRLQSTWTRYLSDQLRIHREEQPREQAFKMLAPNRRQIASWIFNAWTDLTGSIVRNGFNKILHPGGGDTVHASSDDTINDSNDDPELGVAATVINALESLHLVDRSVAEISSRTAIEDEDHS